MPAVDQHTRRRIMRTGLTALDKERVCPGYILYTPLFSPGTTYLISREGREVHRWNLPYPPGMYSYLLPNGNLFYMGKVRDETWDRFPVWRWIKGGVLLEVDWTGRIVWEHVASDHHHDARRTAAGGVIYLTIEQVPADIAAKVQGGLPGSDGDGMWADGIVEVDTAGRRIWEWHAFEHLDPQTDTLPTNASRRE